MTDTNKMSANFGNALNAFANAADAITSITIAPGVYDALASIATPAIPTHFADVITEVKYRPAAR